VTFTVQLMSVFLNTPAISSKNIKHKDDMSCKFFNFHLYILEGNAEILNNLWGYEPSRNSVVVPARQATQPGEIGSLESILGFFKSLKIRTEFRSPFKEVLRREIQGLKVLPVYIS
jgi:hypothetical protein